MADLNSTISTPLGTTLVHWPQRLERWGHYVAQPSSSERTPSSALAAPRPRAARSGGGGAPPGSVLPSVSSHLSRPTGHSSGIGPLLVVESVISPSHRDRLSL